MIVGAGCRKEAKMMGSRMIKVWSNMNIPVNHALESRWFRWREFDAAHTTCSVFPDINVLVPNLDCFTQEM